MSNKDFVIKKSNSPFNNALVKKHQEVKALWIEEEGEFDDKQLAKERYKDKPTFCQYDHRVNNRTIVSRLGGGYLEVLIDKVSLSVEDIFHDIVILNTPYEIKERFMLGEICYYNGEYYAVFDDRQDGINLFNRLWVDLTDYCEEYELHIDTDNPIAPFNHHGTLLLKSEHFQKPIQINVFVYNYIDETIPDNFPVISDLTGSHSFNYFKPTSRQLRFLNPTGNITGIKINGKEVKNTNDSFPLLGVHEESGYVEFVGNNLNQFYFNYTVPRLNENLDLNYDIEIQINNEWITTIPYKETLLYRDNVDFPRENINYTHDTIYHGVPASLNVNISNNWFNQYSAKYPDKVTLEYGKQIETLDLIPLGNEQYQTSTFTLVTPLEQKPKEFKLSYHFQHTVENRQGLGWYIGNGYSLEDIQALPKDNIQVSMNPDNIVVKEYSPLKHNLNITYTGSMELTNVFLVSIYDKNKIFTLSDFNVIKEDDQYYLVCNKYFKTPKILSTEIVFSFEYQCLRKDNTTIKSQVETFNWEIAIQLVNPAFQVLPKSITGDEVGFIKVGFDIRNTVLNSLTERYNEDVNYVADGILSLTHPDNKTEVIPFYWDRLNKHWIIEPFITQEGIFKLNYKEGLHLSEEASFEYKMKDIGLDIQINNQGKLKETHRSVIQLDYIEPIKEIYLSGQPLSSRLSFSNPESFQDTVWAYPIYQQSNKNIIEAIGLDITALKSGKFNQSITITRINDYEFGKRSRVIKSQSTIPKAVDFKFDFTLVDFEYEKYFGGYLDLNDERINDAIVDVFVIRKGIVISKPSMKPLGKGLYVTTDVFISEDYKGETVFDLRIEVNDYTTKYSGIREDHQPYNHQYLQEGELDVINDAR